MTPKELEISGKGYLAYIVFVWVTLAFLAVLTIGAWALVDWVIS